MLKDLEKMEEVAEDGGESEYGSEYGSEYDEDGRGGSYYGSDESGECNIEKAQKKRKTW